MLHGTRRALRVGARSALSFAGASRPRTTGELCERAVGRCAPSNHSFERHGFAAAPAWGSDGGKPPSDPTRG